MDCSIAVADATDSHGRSDETTAGGQIQGVIGEQNEGLTVGISHSPQFLRPPACLVRGAGASDSHRTNRESAMFE
jgi:hypothetical protein